MNVELTYIEFRRVGAGLRPAFCLMGVVGIILKKWLQVKGIWIDYFRFTIYYFGVD